MNRLATLLLATLVAAPLAPAARAQAPTTMRTDAIWAPTTTGAIALDGSLDEAAWASAPVIQITYGQRAGDPGSGYHSEGGLMTPPNPTSAAVKFLVSGGQLYMGAVVQDNSIGGSREFNRKDGFLMSIMSGQVPTIGAPGFNEYFYSWWYATLPEGEPIPDVPGFIGTYGNFDNPLVRTPEQIAKWDAVTVVNGTPNDDSGAPDVGYTVEMRFDLSDLGYDLTQPVQVPFSISVYDVDGFFPFNDATFAANRVWWQNAFNGPVQNYGRIFVDPAVTPAANYPPMPYDLVVANAAGLPVTVDGTLDEEVWSRIPGLPMAFVADEADTDAIAIRQAYPGITAQASGQFQPELDLDGDGVNDPRAAVLDPGRATVKWFHRDGRLYVGVDVQDQAVTGGEASEDRWDGFRLGLNSRTELEPNDHLLMPLALAMHLDATGQPMAEEQLAALIAADPTSVEMAVSLGDQTVINDASQADNGYTIEMSISLAALGYTGTAAGQPIFIGANLFDYDTFDDPLAGYGTRAWFSRERANASAAYGFLNDQLLTAGEAGPAELSAGIRLVGAQPNPARRATTLRYELPEAGTATVEVYDQLGRRVATVAAGAQAAGANAAEAALDLPSGIYLFRVRLDGVSSTQVSPRGPQPLERALGPRI